MSNNFVKITRKKTIKIEPFETADNVFLSESESVHIESLADILEYPREEWPIRFDRCKDLSLSDSHAGDELFSQFCLDIHKLPILEMQELYTRTFDLSPLCALEVGYHLFGEDYKRGEFLAKLRETENPFELGQENQLPDYLPVVLRLMTRMDDPELRASLIGFCLIPALTRMSDAFSKKENPYGNLILYLRETLEGIAKRSLSVIRDSEQARCQYV